MMWSEVMEGMIGMYNNRDESQRNVKVEIMNDEQVCVWRGIEDRYEKESSGK